MEQSLKGPIRISRGAEGGVITSREIHYMFTMIRLLVPRSLSEQVSNFGTNWLRKESAMENSSTIPCDVWKCVVFM